MKYLVPIALFIAAFIRIALPWNYIFTNGGVRFGQVDSYFSMFIVNNIQNLSHTTFGNISEYRALNEYIIYGISLIFGNSEIVGALLNAIYGVFTVFLVYLLAKELFNKQIALISIFIAALLPGEFLIRSALGYTDHHALDLLLFCSAMLFYIKWNKNPFNIKNLGFYILFSIAMYLTWQGWLLLLVIPILQFATSWIIDAWKIDKRISFIFAGIFTILVICVLYFVPYFRDLIATRIFWNPEYAITEGTPLLFQNGEFTLSPAWYNFGVLFFVFLFGVGFIWKRNNLLLLVWTLVILAATLAGSRFAQYLAINVALVCGYLLYTIYKYFKPKLTYTVLFAAIMVIPLLLNISLISKPGPEYMNDSWNDALTWLNKNGTGKVCTHWDYGYWIYDKTKMSMISSPGDPSKRIVVSTIMTYNDTEASRFLSVLGIKYLVIDDYMVGDKYKTYGYYSNKDLPNRLDTVGCQLFYGESKYFNKVFDTPEVKIFECKLK
jgi:asparagine N-glycosylation enzyme membrane subunit Stt3